MYDLFTAILILASLLVGVGFIWRARREQKHSWLLGVFGFVLLYTLGGALAVLLTLEDLRRMSVPTPLPFLVGGLVLALLGLALIGFTRARPDKPRLPEPPLGRAPTAESRAAETRVTDTVPQPEVAPDEGFTGSLPPASALDPEEVANPADEEVIPTLSLASEEGPDLDWSEDRFALRRPGGKLFSPGDVALATFLGGLAGGGLILALNYRTLGKGAAGWISLLVTFLVQVALGALLIPIPEPAGRCFGLVLAVAGIVAMYHVAQQVQGPAFARHTKQGGEKASGCGAALFGVLGGVATIAVVVVVALGIDAVPGFGMGTAVPFGAGEEVYYTSGATEADARRVGRALQAAGFFDGTGGKTVQVQKSGNRYIVSMVVHRFAANDPAIVGEFDQIRRTLSQNAFDGRPVELRLCDEFLQTLKTLR